MKSFVINTTPDLFEDWLHSQPLPTRLRGEDTDTLPNEDTSPKTELSGLVWAGSDYRPRGSIRTHALNYMLLLIRRDPIEAYGPYEAIVFVVYRPSPDRLRIQVENRTTNPAIEALCLELIAALLNDYPEAREATIEVQPTPAPSAPVAVSDTMPLLPSRASEEQWFAWFDWYYSQAWGPVSNKAEHMAGLNGKSISQNESRHQAYMDQARNVLNDRRN